MAATAALIFAGKSVATPAISFIVNKAFRYLREWHQQAEGLELAKHKLSSKLKLIQAVYDAVDRQEIVEQSEALDECLWRFRDAVEGAEDALDEIDYYKLEEEAKAHNLQQVRSLVTNFFKEKFVGKVARTTSEVNMVNKLKEAIQKLDCVAEDVGSFLQLLCRVDNLVLQEHAETSEQQTSSTLVPIEIFGREAEKIQVMWWLTDNAYDDLDTVTRGWSFSPDNVYDDLDTAIQCWRCSTRNVYDDPDAVTRCWSCSLLLRKKHIATRVPIVAIIGIGGIGKTTLAQIVCEELKDSAHFDLVLWVHVSDNAFSSTRITKKILEAVTKVKPNADSLDALQQVLIDNINRKKILLILDDVWEDGKRSEWETLMAPLRSSRIGSRILLTTRMSSVADMVAGVMGGTRKEYLHLDGLNEDENFMLFKKYAFDGLNSEDYAHLLPVARKIAKEFRGCPLVTKIAGGHLRSNVSDQHWENLHRQLEHLKGSTDAIVTTVLQSSYHHLPEHLQLCFRYCGIFPKGHQFKKEDIVKMWMGSGLILQIKGGNERPEDIGETYFVQLARKSFFTFVPIVDPYQKDYMEYYAMHDLLHELARNVSSGECLRTESSGFLHHQCTVRHLWIANFSKLSSKEIEAISRFKCLRTLVIEDSYHVSTDHVAALEEVIKSINCLRLLSFKGITKFCFANEVANKHLRYISFSRMEKVDGLSKLYHLQVLTAAKRIGTTFEQVENMENLSRLRYVSYGSNGFGEFLVGRLTSLQELYNFEIQPMEGYRISSLMNLTSLCKLRVCNLENVGSHDEVVEAKLNEKSYLRSLSLNWSKTNDALKEDNLVLDKLEPHAHLGNLEIAGYSGVRFPSWINHLVSMVSLELRECQNWVYLPSLGNLQLLKHLELQDLTRLKQIGESSGDSLPQNLKTLVVKGCQRLRKLPLLPLTLMQLEIESVGLDIFPRIRVNDENVGSETTPPKLVSVIISNCSNLTTLAESFLLQEHCICTLRTLNIVGCDKLIHAPLLFGKMNDLTEFRIGSCYSLRMVEKVDGGLLPSTLKELSVVQCGDLQLPLLNSLVGLTNLTSLSLCNCSRVKSLPSSAVFTSLKALREMVVTNCVSLSSLGGLGALSYLSWLVITDCDRLMVSAQSGEMDGGSSLEVNLRVCSLWIHTPSMLDKEPLRGLCDAKNLIISVGCGSTISEQWVRQNIMSLESLHILKPEIEFWLGGFRSLKRLEFDQVPQHLAFPHLPSSLESFIVGECDPEALESWKKLAWEQISLISHVRIGDTCYHLGKETRATNLISKATHFDSCGSLIRGKKTRR